MAGASLFPAAAQDRIPVEPVSLEFVTDETGRGDFVERRRIVLTDKTCPGWAMMSSLGATVGPGLIGTVLNDPTSGRFAMATAGLLLGPSVGHLYAEDVTQALVGLGLRLGAPLFLLTGSPGLVLAPALLVGSGVYDVATAWDSAQEFYRTRTVQFEVRPRVGTRGEHVGLDSASPFEREGFFGRRAEAGRREGRVGVPYGAVVVVRLEAVAGVPEASFQASFSKKSVLVLFAVPKSYVA